MLTRVNPSALRLTLYALLSAIELDLRLSLRTHLTSQAAGGTLFTPEETTKYADRQKKAEKILLSHLSDDELIEFVDFGDYVELALRHKALLEPAIVSSYKQLVTKVGLLVPIRNRVMHSRPLESDDFSTLFDVAQALIQIQGIDWDNLQLTMRHLQQEPQYVLRLRIPEIPWAKDSELPHNLPLPEFDDTGFIGRSKDKEDIRSELGLVNMDILWSGALLVPLIALCATMPPRQRDSKELAGWLALAALCHRYSGSSETALDQDLRACRAAEPVGSLLTNLRAVRTSLLAQPEDFGGALADRSGLLTLYIACMNRGVLDFYTGGKVLLQNNVDRHHILPRAQFPEGLRTTADNIANMALIAGDVNKSIGHTGPEVYLEKVKSRVLESQCIPTDSTLWRIDQAEAFWRARRELLAQSFNKYVREALPQRRI